MVQHSEVISNSQIDIEINDDDELKTLALAILGTLDEFDIDFMTKEKALHLVNEVLFKGLVKNVNPNTYLD